MSALEMSSKHGRWVAPGSGTVVASHLISLKVVESPERKVHHLSDF